MATQVSQFLALQANSINQAIQQPGVLDYMIKRHLPSHFHFVSQNDEIIKTAHISNYPNLGKGGLGDLIEFSSSVEQALINVIHKKGDQLVGIYYEGKKAVFGTLHAIINRFVQKAKIPTDKIQTAFYETDVDDLRASAKLKHIELVMKEFKLEPELTDQPIRTSLPSPA